MIGVSIVTYHTSLEELGKCLSCLTSPLIGKIYIVDNAAEEVKKAADIVLPRCEENAIMHLICFLEEMYD